MQGVRHIPVSEQIAMQWKDGTGVHFAHRIRFIAYHYQLFKQLPPEKQGRYTDRSLLSDKELQMAARTYLTSLPTGEVTPTCFCYILNEHILPLLRHTLKNMLSECTAQQWLIKLGLRNKHLGQGVYMDGYEQPDVVEYQNNTFLPLMALYQGRMVKWKLEGLRLVCIDPELRLGEK